MTIQGGQQLRMLLEKLKNVLGLKRVFWSIFFLGSVCIVLGQIVAPNAISPAAWLTTLAALISFAFNFAQAYSTVPAQRQAVSSSTGISSHPIGTPPSVAPKPQFQKPYSAIQSSHPIGTPPSVAPKPQHKRKFPFWFMLLASLSFLTLGHIGFLYPSYSSTACTPAPEWRVDKVVWDTFWPGPVSAKKLDEECIGISEGGYKLDATGLGDSSTMAQAASFYRFGSTDDAKNLWSQARKQAPEDAEPLVYTEDLAAQNATQYYDILVVTMLSGNSESTNTGQNQLRGFSVALDDYNRSAAGPLYNTPVRFLITNVGSDSQYADQIEQQIEQLAKQDKDHLIGILGWPISSSQAIISDIQSLAQIKIPIISPTATADALSQINPYFFRMVPPNAVQAKADISLVKAAVASASPSLSRPIRVETLVTQWSDGTPVPYSESLARDFKDYVGLEKTPTIDIIEEHSFVHLQEQSVDAAIDAAEHNRADVIYMPGYSQDATIALNYLQRTYPQSPLIIVGGDGLGHVKDYPHSGYPSSANQRLSYTSFTLPHNQCRQETATFYNHYFQDFQLCPENDAMLAYDAASTMLYAMDQAMIAYPHSRVTPDALWNALKNINDRHPYKGGVTGDVVFQNSDRANLPLYAFSVDRHGLLQMIPLSGDS